MVKPAILIIGFNRPQMIKERLAAVSPLVDQGTTVYVSIDGPRNGNTSDKESIEQILRHIEESQSSNHIFKWLSSTNSGCDVHIFNSIAKVLENHEIVVVIEDDIEVSALAINHVVEKAKEILGKGLPNPIVTMSGLSRGFLGIENKWRESNYFSAWGFALNRIFWELHTNNLKTINSSEVEMKLKYTSNWRKFSNRKKILWLERLNRGNYDYAIQRTIFLEEIKSIAPVFRLSNNIGHGVSGASHTRFRTPWFLKHSVMGRNDRWKEKSLDSRWIIAALKWLDSQTWAGDGLLSVRGRNVGVRTALKKIVQQGNRHE
jgi:hypothetical protein